MTTPESVTVTLELSDREAYALAQFVKRLGFAGIRECASSVDETYDMKDGIHCLQRALRDVGYAPR